MTDIPVTGSTAAIVFSQPPIRVEITVSNVSTQEPAPPLESGTAKFLSASNRSYFADLPRNDRVITDVPATLSILPALDGSLFSLGPNNELIMPTTGANGKRVIVRATHADTSKTDQLVTYYEKAAPAHPCLAIMGIASWETFEGLSHANFDASNSDIWMIFATYPDETGKLITSYFHRNENGEQPTLGAAWSKGIADRVNAAGKKAVVAIGGAGTWPNVRVALADDTKRAQFAVDILAEVDRLGVHGVALDFEQNGPDFTDQEFLWHLDLIRRLRDARPSLHLDYPTYGQILIGTQPSEKGGCPDLLPAIFTYADTVLLMSYSCSPANEGWTSWLSDPLYGEVAGHPISVGTAINFFRAMHVPTEVLMLPSATFYSMFGPDITGMHQPISGTGRNAAVPDDTGMYLHLLPGGKFAPTGYVDHYQPRYKDNFRILTAPVDGFSYFANEVPQTWADKREACKGFNHWSTPEKTVRFRGVECWRYGHGGENIVPQWYSALSTDTIPASVDPPLFGGGTQVSIDTFADGTIGAWSAWCTMDGWWQNTNAPLSVVNGALKIAASSTIQWPQAYRGFTGLTVGHEYTVSFDVVSGVGWAVVAPNNDGANRVAVVDLPAAGANGLFFVATASTMYLVPGPNTDSTGHVGDLTLDNVRLGAY